MGLSSYVEKIKQEKEINFEIPTHRLHFFLEPVYNMQILSN